MKFVDFFGKNIKPYTIRGKKLLNPADTAIISEGVSCIREIDVNIWFYTKGNTTIAIDSGYRNYPNIDEELSQINIKPSNIDAVFLTHADIDHAGGVDIENKPIFTRADVYLGKNELVHIVNSCPRSTVFFIKINNSIKLHEGYQLLEDNSIINIGDIKIQAIETPGHTTGHICYLVDDKILFTGDSIAINKSGGYCFFDFFNINSQQNIKSLHRLKQFISTKPIKMVCTGHSGYTYDAQFAFNHTDETARGSRKKPFDTDAPYDVFKE